MSPKIQCYPWTSTTFGSKKSNQASTLVKFLTYASVSNCDDQSFDMYRSILILICIILHRSLIFNLLIQLCSFQIIELTHQRQYNLKELSRIQMKAEPIFVIFIVIFSAMVLQSNSFDMKGIILLNTQNFELAMQKFPNLVVYFSSKNCGYCGQMDLAYAVLQEKYRNSTQGLNGVYFGKIYHEQSWQIFAEYEIEAVPTLRMFKQIQILQEQFDSIDYHEDAIPYATRWIDRLIAQSLPQWEKRNQDQSVFNINVIVTCDSTAVEEVKKMSHTDIYADYFCTKDRSLLSNERSMLVIAPHQEHKLYDLPSQAQKIRETIRAKTNYHRKIAKWGNYAIRQLFTHEQSMFIVLVNKEHRSDSMLRVLSKIRQERTDIPFLFVAAQLQQDIQGVSKLKEYIGVVSHEVYPFPLLVFVTHKDGRVVKYSYGEIVQEDIDFKKNADGQYFDKKNISSWIDKALKGDLQEHFRAFDLSPLDQFFSEPTRDVIRIHFPDFMFLLTEEYEQQFLVFIEYRNDHHCNYIEDSIIKRWYQTDQSNEINMFLYALNQNDLPAQFQTMVTRVPSLMYIDKDKKATVLEDIQKYEDDIVPFLKKVVKPYTGPRSEVEEGTKSIEQNKNDMEHHEESVQTLENKPKSIQPNFEQKHQVQKEQKK